MEIGTDEYERLNKDSVVWFCCKCDSANHTNSLFHSYELVLYNSFDILSSLPVADRPGNSSNVTSLPSPTSFSPRVHSSPSLQTSDNAPSRIATPDTSRRSSYGLLGAPPKNNNWRSLIVNCNSIQGKASSLRVAGNYIDPDVQARSISGQC